MTKPLPVAPKYAKTTVEELRTKLFRDKAEYRRYLAQAPIVEKLRIMEEMRDFTAAMQHAREENKASVKEAWVRSVWNTFGATAIIQPSNQHLHVWPKVSYCPWTMGLNSPAVPSDQMQFCFFSKNNAPSHYVFANNNTLALAA
jgi:hypothetical protein